MKISASLIRALAEDGHCPKKIDSRYNLNIDSDETSNAMASGNYFEQVTTFYMYTNAGDLMYEMGKYLDNLEINYNDIKATAELYWEVLKKVVGVIDPPEHLLTKRIKDKYGSDLWLSELWRLYYQAAKFYSLLKQYRFFENPFSMHERVFAKWNKNEAIDLNGEYDLYCKLFIDGEFHDFIIDLKFTANVFNDFGAFCWGTPELMDHTQPILYMKITWLHEKPRRFMYWVFDHKAVPNFKPIEKEFTTLNDYEIDESIRKTVEKASIYNITGWPANPSMKNCKTCLLKTTCEAFKLNPPVPIIYKI